LLCAPPLQLTFTKPHILLLDEPSNHLDIDAVDALIEGLALFKGGVLMVRVWGGGFGVVCWWLLTFGVVQKMHTECCLSLPCMHRLFALCLPLLLFCQVSLAAATPLPQPPAPSPRLPVAAAAAAAVQVSHDQYLIESTVDELWCCEGGQVSTAAAAAEHGREGAACIVDMHAAADYRVARTGARWLHISTASTH
jgi:hypothetical protein